MKSRKEISTSDKKPNELSQLIWQSKVNITYYYR